MARIDRPRYCDSKNSPITKRQRTWLTKVGIAVMEVKNDQWRRLENVVDAVLAMPTDTVKDDDDMPEPESKESADHGDR